MSQGREQLGELGFSGTPGARALGAAALAPSSQGFRGFAPRRGTGPACLAEGPWCSWGPRARPRPPGGTGAGRGGAGGVGRGRAVLGARRRPSGPARPPVLSTPLGPLSSPPTLSSPLPGGPVRGAARRSRPGDRGARWSWRSRVARQAWGARPDLVRRGVEGAGSGGAPKGKQGRGYRGNGQACAPGCEGLELQTHFSPRRAATGRPGRREGSGAGREEGGEGWAGPGGLADGEQVGGDRGPAERGAAARWRAACANRASASWARRTVRPFGLGAPAPRARFSVQDH